MPTPRPRHRDVTRTKLGARGVAISSRRYGNEQAFLSVLDAIDTDGAPVLDVDQHRPRTRAECEAGERPCPFVGCRHHLAIDITFAGSLHFTRPDLEAMPETCSLDVADRGEQTLDQVGVLLNITKERVRQIEVRGLQKVRALAQLAGVLDDAVPFVPDRDHPPEI